MKMWKKKDELIKHLKTLEQPYNKKLSKDNQFNQMMPTLNMRNIYPHIKITMILMIKLERTQKQIKTKNQTQKIKIKAKKDIKVISINIKDNYIT